MIPAADRREPAAPQVRPRGSRFVAALPWALLALCAWITADFVIAESLCCADDALFSMVAKNVATGAGYVASYHAGPGARTVTGPLAWGVGLGPTLILPAALAIRLVGFLYWVPGATVWLANFTLVVALFLRIRRVAISRTAAALSSAFALGALQLATLENYEHWYAFLGEIPTLLLVSLGLALAATAGSRREVGIGALVAGLGVQIKLLAFLALHVVLFVAFRAGLHGFARPSPEAPRARSLRAAIAAAAAALALFVAPTAAFEMSKLALLGVHGYVESVRGFHEHLTITPGSGATPGTFAALPATLRQNARTFASSWRNPLAWAIPAAVLAGLAAPRRAAFALHAAAAIHLGWWLLLSTGGRYRYLMIGLGYAICAAALDFADGAWSARKSVLALLFAAALVPRLELLPRARPPVPWFTASARVESMLETARYLEGRRAGAWLASDWWACAVDMEYLLRGSSNFLHVTELPERPDRDVLFLENAFFTDLSPGYRATWDRWIERFGAKQVFSSGRYRVYRGPAVVAEKPGGTPGAAPGAESRESAAP